MSRLAAIADADVAGRTVLVRADLNLPMHRGEVADATRLGRFAPTVRGLIERGAGVVVMSHLGRPRGEPNAGLTLAPVAEALAGALGLPVAFAPDCVGAAAEKVTANLRPGTLAMLENLRFHRGEEADDPSFARMLSVHGDLYVNDAFSCAHRAHASTHAIARLMPAFAGPSLLAEVEALEQALTAPRRPVAALVGGAKVSSKIDILGHLLTRADTLIVGGGMANTFLAAQGHPTGRSLVEPDAVPTARRILDEAARAGCTIILPLDVVVARAFAADAPSEVVAVDAIPADAMALDVGPATIERILAALSGANTLVWNGPLGAFELAPFGQGTFRVAQAAADLTARHGLLSVAGGGDTGAALAAAGVADRFSYLSTAGGAFLEWLEGKTLPGIEALRSSTPILEES